MPLHNKDYKAIKTVLWSLTWPYVWSELIQHRPSQWIDHIYIRTVVHDGPSLFNNKMEGRPRFITLLAICFRRARRRRIVDVLMVRTNELINMLIKPKLAATQLAPIYW